MYLTSVRFDRNIFGLIEANMRFYGHIIKNPSRAETFVLLDRLSNIKSEILSLSIINKIERALASKALQKEDIDEILDLYKNLIKKGVIGIHKTGCKDNPDVMIKAITVNPYIFTKGNNVNKTILGLFEHTNWKNS